MEDNGNVIQVISSACEDCPISSYTVTENCQNCIGKACINACKFGAIEPGRSRTHIDPSKCKECGKCAEACPYNAIAHLKRPCKFSCPVDAISYDEYGISVIDDEKCIRCGKCIHSCPFGAIGSKTWIVDVIKAIQSEKPVYAMLAPATEGQFGPDITMASWRKAMKELGFTEFVEVGLGGDLTAKYEAEEWREAYQEGKKKVTSCCPGFVNMVRKHYPELSDAVSTTVSPMCAVSRMIKAKDPEAVTVFIGPCLAKKSEVVDQKIEGNADYVLTYSEIRAMMRAKGAAECKKALLLMKVGRLPEDFIEGMACDGGCVGGPSSFKDQMMAKKSRDALIREADDRGIYKNLSNYDEDSFSMHR